MKRVGMVIGLRDERAEAYRALHADSEGGVRDLLQKYNIHNFSIFARRLDDGREHLFGYYEYWGQDFERDMAQLDECQRNQEWISLTAACQEPVATCDGDSWMAMEEIFHSF